MNLLVANLASPANPGDQAIFSGALKLLREVYPQCDVTISTRGYSDRKVYEKMGCQVVPNYPDVECLATDSKLKKILNIPKSLFRPGPMRKAVKAADIVFLIGGAYFYSYKQIMPGFMYLSHFTAIFWAKIYKKPVVFLPQSYGPFVSGVSKLMFDWAVRSSRFIFYREEISGRWLRENYRQYESKFSYLPDLALYLERHDVLEEVPRKTNQLMGMTIRAWQSKGKTQDDYLKELVAAVSDVAKQKELGVRVIVQVQDPKKGEGDAWISEKLSEALESEIGAERVTLKNQEPYFHLDEICAHYHECDLMIGMRLHSALLSFIVGTPALVSGYQHKAEGILKATGLHDLYLGSFDEVTTDSLKRRSLEVLAEQDKWRTQIHESLAQVRQQIRTIFKEKMTGLLP